MPDAVAQIEEEKGDTGLSSLVVLLHFHGIAADPEQIRHQFASTAISTTDMLRCARELGLKARLVQRDMARLAKTPLPAIAEYKDGSFLVLAKLVDDRVLVQDPVARRPKLLDAAEF